MKYPPCIAETVGELLNSHEHIMKDEQILMCPSLQGHFVALQGPTREPRAFSLPLRLSSTVKKLAMRQTSWKKAAGLLLNPLYMMFLLAEVDAERLMARRDTTCTSSTPSLALAPLVKLHSNQQVEDM